MPERPTRPVVFTLAEVRQLPGSTVAAALVVLALALAATATIARAYHDARTGRAARHYAAGQDALARGDTRRAIVELRAAVALDRDRAPYGLPLSRALLQAGSPREALTYLDPVLRTDPTAGDANVLRARIARALGDDDTALVHYQRALFGAWPEVEGRLAAGAELVDLALAHGRTAQARAALAQLAGDVPQVAADQRRFGDRLRAAGARADARDAYARATALDRRDTAAWTALAEIDFAAGDMRAAQRAATQALAVAPGLAPASRLARLSGEVLALDPESPRLSVAQRLRRERTLLDAVVGAVDDCPAALLAPGTAAARADAARLLAGRPAAFDPAAARALGEQLWQARRDACPGVPEPLEALALVLRRLGEGEPR